MENCLENIDTIVVLLMENRSFDHILGYLSLPPLNRTDVDGLKTDGAYKNTYQGKTYTPFLLNRQILKDPPHERDPIRIQLGKPAAKGSSMPMDGFVESYARKGSDIRDVSLVMGYYGASETPMYDFFVRNFAICDHWFSALPTGTQANRLMAMAGESRIDDNVRLNLPDQELVYNWLDRHDVRWCSYVSGRFPFFMLMPRWRKTILKDLGLRRHRFFRRFSNFRSDWQDNQKSMPSVIFIEPDYTDILDPAPNDDHPPTPLHAGQRFIKSVYDTLTSNAKRWSRTLLIVTYDEHGGCYDHVSPPWIATLPPKGDVYQDGPFETLGVRVPAFIVSPWVDAGVVHHDTLDHTSILALMAERFDKRKSYSPVVDSRNTHLGKLSSMLRAAPRSDIPASPAMPELARAVLPEERPLPEPNATSDAFQQAAEQMRNANPRLWSRLEDTEQAEGMQPKIPERTR